MNPGAVHRSPGIYLMAEENPGKPQVGDCLMKVVRPVIASNAFPYFQMRSVGLQSTSGREKEGKEEVGYPLVLFGKSTTVVFLMLMVNGALCQPAVIWILLAFRKIKKTKNGQYQHNY